MSPVARRMWLGSGTTLAVLALAACAGEPEYRAYTPYRCVAFGFQTGGAGYSEASVRPGYYEVGYNGSPNPTRSRYLATVRAAELTLKQGKPYFEVVQANPGETPATWALVAPSASQPVGGALSAIGGSGGTLNLDNTTSTLLIHVQDSPTPASLDAAELLRQAQRSGIQLDPETCARLRVPGTAGGR